MFYSSQCVCCGSVCTLVASEIFSGWYRCARCREIGVYIPETELTPLPTDPLTLIDYADLDGHWDLM